MKIWIHGYLQACSVRSIRDCFIRIYVTALLEYIILHNKFSRGLSNLSWITDNCINFINCHSDTLLLTHNFLPHILVLQKPKGAQEPPGTPLPTPLKFMQLRNPLYERFQTGKHNDSALQYWGFNTGC